VNAPHTEPPLEPHVEPDAPDAGRVECPACGRAVPDGAFCGACGAHLSGTAAASVHRRYAYAADPAQHVLHPSIVSTLFPHLPHRQRRPFQIAVGLTLLLLVVLSLARLTGPAIAVAALGIPLIYLLYLYQVEVYEDEPVLIVGATLVLGVVVGAVWAYVTGPRITQILLGDSTFGVTAGNVALGGVVLPLAAQALMLLGALALYPRRRYDEALDGFTFGAAGALGFTFGAAGALGFTLAVTIVTLLPTLRQGLQSNVPVGSNLLDILQRGLLTPLINASATGLLAGALWLRRGPIRRLRFHAIAVSWGAAVAGVVVVRVFLGVVSVLLLDPLRNAAAQAIALGLLIVWVRVAIHQMLLTEAVETPIGPALPCSHCHYVVPRMAFCAHCGIATRATPKAGSGRAHRVVR